MTTVKCGATGWLYLAAIIDLYSRRIVGWSWQNRMTENLVLSATEMAISNREINAGLIFHSDRGGQYTGNRVKELLVKHQIRASMGRTGDCYDNAAIESFFVH